MSLRLMCMVFFLVTLVASEDISFTYNGFKGVHLYLDGITELTSNGLLKHTIDTKQQKGHAFYPYPIVFKNNINKSVSCFSTTFVFAIRSEYPTLSGHGIIFVISLTKGLPDSLPSQYLGFFNKTYLGNSSNHVFGAELDTIQSSEFGDINDSHVGIDINDLKSSNSTPAGYYSNGEVFRNVSLFSGYPMQVWVEYDGVKKQIDVTLAPINVGKPEQPLLTLTKGLSPILNTNIMLDSHLLLAQFSLPIMFLVGALISELPKLPKLGEKKESKFVTVGLPLILLSLFFMVTLDVIYFIKRRKMFAELLEDWEQEFGPHRFKFKDLYLAIKGFKQELLGSGGFGSLQRRDAGF